MRFTKPKQGNHFNPLPDMTISGFSNSAANTDTMSKIWTNGNTTI